MLMLEKTSLTMSQTHQTNLNIWSKSATFAASKGKNKFIRNNNELEDFKREYGIQGDIKKIY